MDDETQLKVRKFLKRLGISSQQELNQFIENKYRGYDFYDRANSKVYIDTILYSSDKLKLFSLVIIEKRKIEQGKPFHGMAVIAYREDTSDIWKIYPIDKYSVSWNDYVGSRSVIRRCYFNDLKNKTVIVVDDVMNTGSSIMYAINTILNFSPEKIQVGVLVERNYKNFPIIPDYKGLELSTSPEEHVKVELGNSPKVLII